MSRSTSRLAVAGVLFAGCAGLVLVADPPARGQPPAKDAKKEKDKSERPARDADLPFGFPYERDAKNQLKAARDYLGFKDIPWNIVVPLLQNILDSKTDSFFDLEYQVGTRTEINRISVKTEANRVIGAFRKEGLEFYQQAFGQTAAAALDEAVKANYDLTRLADLSQRYFHTKAGAEGTVLLASVYLERGNYLEAAYAFERLLARPGADDYLTPRTLFRASLALKRSGDPRHAPLAKTVTDRLLAAAGRDGLTIGRRTFTAGQVSAELDRPVAPPKAAGTGLWAGRYGSPGRNAAGAGGPPFLSPAFPPKPLLVAQEDADREAVTRIHDDLEKLFDRQAAPKSLPLPGFFPVATPDLVIYRGYGAVFAVAARDHTHRGRPVAAGDLRWAARTLFGATQLLTEGTYQYGDGKSHEKAKEWWNTYRNAQVPGLLSENPLIGSLAHDGQSVYYLDDIAIPPPPTIQDPNWGWNPNQGVPQSRAIDEAVKAGELNAVDLDTGNLQWTLGRVSTHGGSAAVPAQVAPPATEEDADKSQSAFQLCLGAVFLGPPLPLNGRLYVLVEQAGAVRLLCLDPKTLVEVKVLVTKDPDQDDRAAGRKREVEESARRVPALVWQQKLGRPNNTLPGDSIRRLQGAFLAAGEGILVCPTNSGAVVGVDVMSRSLLWAHAYRKLLPQARPTYAHDPRTGQMILPPQLPNNRWRSAAPVVAGGRVLIAAYDSDKLDCLDIRTGKLLWSVPREADDLYVGGVVNDKVLVVGKAGARALHLLTPDPDDAARPKPAWSVKLPATVTGHGVAGGGVYYLPVRPDNAGKDGVAVAEVWAINADTGAVGTKAAARPRSDPNGADLAKYGVGNLAVQDGLVIAQSAAELAVYPQLDVKRKEMDERLAANPKDPVGLADRGELLLDDGKVKEAVADFREAARNNPPETVQRRLREKLYAAYTELLKADFAGSEGFLKEYAELCELPADTDDPFEKRRREDESLRRQRQYLSLLGRGREAQGRTGEAFEQYLTLAGLGRKGGDRLDPDPDDYALRARADVAARGRIDGLVHKAADPAARKLLEDRVGKEWAAVRAADDLPRLRDFVTVFGATFPAGAEAELRLAEALLATGDENDLRDAQVHLSGLRATAADPAVKAKATEALARSLRAAGLTEDAVGLYAQLGKEFAAAPVRDGKTGADYLTDVLTDKRLLPYLEPARSALPTRVKAEDKREGLPQQGYVLPMFDVEPDGELYPLFRRLRFAVDVTGSGNNTWTLRAYDRVTGAERAMFPNIAPPAGLPGGVTSARFVQASGHLLLVHVGSWVYCFDLADRTDKRERWRKNLLGDGSTMNPTGSADVRGDGDEVALQFSETSGGPRTTVTVGRSTVLQPGYAALLTRDGLEVIEPVSKRPLWTRKNLPDRTHLYGDARHLLLVERGADQKPLATKLLRAVDGMPVDGAPDSGPALNAARSYRVYGRHVLLTEGVGDKPRVLRLLDLATGKDVWRREFPAGSVPVRSSSPEWAGFLTPDGKVELVAARTGRPAGSLAVDAGKVEAHVKGCTEVKLLADADRFYAVLDRGAGGGGAARGNQGYSVRTVAVNGPLYCFDRSTGKRRWYIDDLFDGQRLVLDRFAELPVLVAAAPIQNKATAVTEYKVVVVEKDRGMVRLNKGLPFQQQLVFQNLTVDARAGTVDLNRGDLRVHISAEDGRPAAATVPVTAAPPVGVPQQRMMPK